ncbi:trifunctional hydroxymethylpyrimidine kinase/phosphomethylpyrimidine kinase/thiaminase [Rhodotorula toruloides]
METTVPRVLTIAGSDSGGGAGIQADLKTIAAFHCFGTSAITALTAQNTLGVQAVEGVSPSFVVKQIESVLEDIGADAIKTGMLYDEETIRAIVGMLEKRYGQDKESLRLVVDPVCVSTSGHSLLPLSAVDSLRKDLLPWATVLTPNIPEAEYLAGWESGTIRSVEDMERCAKELANTGARWVYLKGGHMPIEKGAAGDRVVVDLLWDARAKKAATWERRYLDVKNTHGTGCTLAAAAASELARGKTVPEAVRCAADFVASAIATSYSIGNGSGPVNHFHGLMSRTLPLPNPHSPTPFTDYLIAYNPSAWSRYVNHPFPQGLADGTMPLEAFLHFIQQDYHFLKQYGRSNALAAYKTEDMRLMAGSIQIVNDVVRETEMHVKYCEKYGISHAQLQAIPESVTNIAYTRYVLDVASKGDLLDARVVTAPCLIGYGEVGRRLVNATSGVNRDESTNPYWGWIAEYGGDWYQGAVKTGIDVLEQTLHDSPISPSRLADLARVFEKATELEIAFWDAALEAGKKKREEVLDTKGGMPQ